MTERWVYYFGEGDVKNKALLGGKGCGLSEMRNIGLPVPPGFTITTKACVYYSKNQKHPQELKEQVEEQMQRLLQEENKSFGANRDDGKALLLLSVRSGAAVSMPGMMDTVLNLGLNDQTVQYLAEKSQNERFAWDSYRRFIAMFGDVVLDVPHHSFEQAIDQQKKKAGAKVDTDLSTSDLKELVQRFKSLVKQTTGQDFPQNPWDQLWRSIEAVFKSWDNDRAVAYRSMHGLSHSMGTAVNVQAMVFGNMGPSSGTGVAFTRNPSTGENVYYGEYLTNAQGEDVVAGIRTPETISAMKKHWPDIYKQLTQAFDTLEMHFRDMQDCEFTIENGKLYLLQTRVGKRTAAAAVKIAVDMHHEGLMTKHQALLSVDPSAIGQLLHRQLDPAGKANAKLIGEGLPASPGAGVGQVVFSAQAAIDAKAKGVPTVLVRLETSPEDIMGMHSAEGVLTSRGGMTSHAAVVARGMGKCCVAGCAALVFPDDHGHGHSAKECTIGNVHIKEGDWITLDGSTGEIFLGKLPVVDAKVAGDYATVMEWANEVRELGVRTNADTGRDARKALEFGAQGIGLVRTEHMFFDDDRIVVMRQMILAQSDAQRKLALDRLLPFQQSDFEEIFTVMSGKPVIIRLLDPPLHEFLPHTEEDIESLSKISGIPVETVRETAVAMKEQNPMLGFRGCRLAIVNPQITEMQVKAIFQAALKVKSLGYTPIPEIEVPLVGSIDEYLPIKHLIQRVAKETKATGQIKYKIGTMVEVPRAALTADRFASEVDFMSFGTNDLTQMTCGFSRDDSAVFLKAYVRQGIYTRDPFVSIDQTGVGQLMQTCVALARGVNPDLEIGVCGEHGGDPASVEFCHRIGLTDVSCSPFRVPTAILAAAHAAIKYGPRPKTLALKNIPCKL